MKYFLRPSNMETIGVLIGIGGAITILLDIESVSATSTTTTIRQPSIEGDMAAFIGALAVSMYLLIGQNLRTWIPLWMYTFPVILAAIVTSVFLAFLDPEAPAQWGGGRDPSRSMYSVFGFLDPRFFWISFYLGAGPGTFLLENLILHFFAEFFLCLTGIGNV